MWSAPSPWTAVFTLFPLRFHARHSLLRVITGRRFLSGLHRPRPYFSSLRFLFWIRLCLVRCGFGRDLRLAPGRRTRLAEGGGGWGGGGGGGWGGGHRTLWDLTVMATFAGFVSGMSSSRSRFSARPMLPHARTDHNDF